MSRQEAVQQDNPPQFTENEPPMSSQPDGVSGELPEKGIAPDFTSHPEADFPGVGELPVPHVNPLTAHVIPHQSRLTIVSSIHPPAILRLVRGG